MAQGILEMKSSGSKGDFDKGWPCACVRRNSHGRMSAIKMHSIKNKRCRVCGAERPEIGKYLCSACGVLLDRESSKAWIKSYCTVCERNVRIYRV